MLFGYLLFRRMELMFSSSCCSLLFTTQLLLLRNYYLRHNHYTKRKLQHELENISSILPDNKYPESIIQITMSKKLPKAQFS